MIHSQSKIRGANIILLDSDRILLQLRDDKPTIAYPNHWALPGGKAELNEPPEDNAKREMFEECGYQLQQPKLVYQHTITRDDGIEVDEYIFIEPYDGQQEIQCREGQAMQFIALSDLSTLQMVPWELTLIGKLQQDNVLPSS